jgi:hypothetical protein
MSAPTPIFLRPIAAVIALAFWCSALPDSRAATLTDAELTEFVADNGDDIRDEDGDREDWIEIWNASGVAGNFGGWYLTDDPNNLTKWMLPAIEMASGGYLKVFASGKDRATADGEPHTNFRLQREAGGYLALVKPDGATIASKFVDYPRQFTNIAYGVSIENEMPLTFVSAGADARWHVPEGPVGGWTEGGFDDAAWSSGATGIGYDGSIKYDYLFGGGGDIEAKMRGINGSVYIRIAFEVPDPTGIGSLKLRMKWEDGFIAHLNGIKVHAESAPANSVWNSVATGRRSDEDAAQTFFDYPLNRGGLVAGTNVLAIQGLNESTGSSDVLFVPELAGIFQDVNTLVEGFFVDLTPEAENGKRYDGIVDDTQFSLDRGFYDAPINLAITTNVADAEIRYTTDGTTPSETRGTVYTGPVTIGETTVLRAIGYKPGFRSTDVDTQTYIFAADIHGADMVDSLKAVPTISLVTEHTAFENEGSGNIRDEHQASVEMIFPDGTPGFQEDGGLSNYGGRYTNFRKKSFRIAFRSEFGATKLRYPIFDGFEYKHFPPAEQFDSINLRSGSHDMSIRGAYMSNRFTDDSMLEMGNIAPHGRFVHVYLNGRYWGQYHLRERWNADMASSYFGGSEDDYESVNANDNFRDDEDVYDGTGEFWRETKTLVWGPDPFVNAADHIDIANTIDFMLLWLSGNSESEFRCFGSEALGVPFKFMIKDADGFLGNPGHSISNTGLSPLNIMGELHTGGNGDYPILLADRIHKHFFNDGALTGPKMVARLRRRMDEASLGFFSEAARWNFRTAASWKSQNNSNLNFLLPNLTQDMIYRFKQANMYPDIIAPVYGQHGGSVALGAGVSMSTNATAVYYTLDGFDPRLSGGTINPEAIRATFANDVPTPKDFISSGDVWKYLDDGSDQGAAWRASGFDDSTWQSGASELGYGDPPGEHGQTTAVGFIDTDPVASGPQRNATTYFRKKVTLSEPTAYSFFEIKLKYDDGAAVYVNGSEVLRTDTLPANAAFDTFTTARTPNERKLFLFKVSSSAFVDGENTLAVELHNERATSSDISFDLILRGEIDTTNGNNITDPVILNAPALVNARAYNVSTKEWSALNSAFFSINSVPAAPSNIVISEFNYHPEEPVRVEEAAVSTDRDDYEFVEFLNIGAQPIELGGVAFTDGITYTFPANTLLKAGERAVIVSNTAAFTARYGELPDGVFVGDYSGRLSNDGERVALGGSGGPLIEFSYNNEPPWPTLPDGFGHTMVLVDAGSNPDHNDPASWLPGDTLDGVPGGRDGTIELGYLSWKSVNNVNNDNADKDGDGITSFGEYAFGTLPSVPDPGALPTPSIIEVGDQGYLAITFQKSLLATDVVFQVQSTESLATWTDGAAVVFVSETPNPDGQTATVVWRSVTPIEPGGTQYLRLVMNLIGGG